jgi:hypothetical protein
MTFLGYHVITNVFFSIIWFHQSIEVFLEKLLLYLTHFPSFKNKKSENKEILPQKITIDFIKT